jgi:hypothetical protein
MRPVRRVVGDDLQRPDGVIGAVKDRCLVLAIDYPPPEAAGTVLDGLVRRIERELGHEAGALGLPPETHALLVQAFEKEPGHPAVARTRCPIRPRRTPARRRPDAGCAGKPDQARRDGGRPALRPSQLWVRSLRGRDVEGHRLAPGAGGFSMKASSAGGEGTLWLCDPPQCPARAAAPLLFGPRRLQTPTQSWMKASRSAPGSLRGADTRATPRWVPQCGAAPAPRHQPGLRMEIIFRKTVTWMTRRS